MPYESYEAAKAAADEFNEKYPVRSEIYVDATGELQVVSEPAFAFKTSNLVRFVSFRMRGGSRGFNETHYVNPEILSQQFAYPEINKRIQSASEEVWALFQKALGDYYELSISEERNRGVYLSVTYNLTHNREGEDSEFEQIIIKESDTFNCVEVRWYNGWHGDLAIFPYTDIKTFELMFRTMFPDMFKD